MSCFWHSEGYSHNCCPCCNNNKYWDTYCQTWLTQNNMPTVLLYMLTICFVHGNYITISERFRSCFDTWWKQQSHFMRTEHIMLETSFIFKCYACIFKETINKSVFNFVFFLFHIPWNMLEISTLVMIY